MAKFIISVIRRYLQKLHYLFTIPKPELDENQRCYESNLSQTYAFVLTILLRSEV